MLTVQACQQYRQVVMQPNKVKSFPAATVRRRGKRGSRSEESRDAPNKERSFPAATVQLVHRRRGK